MQPPRQRLTGSEREIAILEGAADIFAEEGFKVGTRRLASRLGVTPALLYRYFESKDDLILSVFTHAFAEHWDDSWTAILQQRKRPLEGRIAEFYTAYVLARDRRYIRLFLRGCLDGYRAATRYGTPLDERVLKPVLTQMRRKLQLPSLIERPMTRTERELVLAMHGQMFYMMMRSHAFGLPVPSDLPELIALQVRATLPGLLDELAALHAKDGPADPISLDRTLMSTA
ncbi:MAG: helix-turn-helix domain-containing protein [Rhodovibrionaceae bacterium]|nr:helix-turn-helix domain-containing protein [Rhodovibrionaceae bacterium]